MSKVPTRPGAVRPGATRTSPAATADPSQYTAIVQGGVDANVDPDEATDLLVDETVTIVAAKWIYQDWRKRDGTVAPGSTPVVQLEIGVKRDANSDDRTPYRIRYDYTFGDQYTKFGVNEDGSKVVVRPSAVKDKYVPKISNKAQAMIFLKSIKQTGPDGAALIEKMKTVGAPALNGLRVHLRKQRSAEMKETWKPLLLADFIETNGAAPSAAPSTARSTKTSEKATVAAPAVAAAAVQAPEAQAGVSDEIKAFATEALMDILSKAPGKTISRNQIAPNVIRDARWNADVKLRSQILQAMREREFIENPDAMWTFDAATVTSK